MKKKRKSSTSKSSTSSLRLKVSALFVAGVVAVFVIFALVNPTPPIDPPPPDPTGEDVNIWAFGDIHLGASPLFEVDYPFSVQSFRGAVDDIDSVITPDYVFSMGDILTNPTYNYGDYLSVRSTSSCPDSRWFEVCGNHDDKTSNLFSPRYYDLQVGNVLFLFIGDQGPDDTSPGTLPPGALTWLSSQITSNSDMNIIIVSHHHIGGSPTGATGWALSAGWEESSQLLSLFSGASNVDAYLHSHIHLSYNGVGWDVYPMHGIQSGIEFINVSPITTAGHWGASGERKPTSSRVFEFKHESSMVVVRTRAHLDANNNDIGQWLDGYTFTFQLTYAFDNPTEQVLGDVNMDSWVNIFDVCLIGVAYMSIPSDERWNQSCDLNKDNRVDLMDLTIVAGNYGLRNFAFFY